METLFLNKSDLKNIVDKFDTRKIEFDKDASLIQEFNFESIWKVGTKELDAKFIFIIEEYDNHLKCITSDIEFTAFNLELEIECMYDENELGSILNGLIFEINR